MILKTLTLLLAATTLLTPTEQQQRSNSAFTHRTLLYAPYSPSSSSQQRSRSTLPWAYLHPRSDSNESGAVVTDDDSAGSTSSSEVPVSAPGDSVSVESAEEATSSSNEDVVVPEQQVVRVVPASVQKGDRGVIVKKPVTADSESEEDSSADRELSPAAKDFITFSYYPINQVVDNGGSVLYEIQDAELRTARGGGWGKGKKGKGCKKGKKGKKGKGKGKKKKGKKGKKGCALKGGWWYYYDKKHGYVSGRWGSPPPKGLEREHYWHNYGKLGHGYGQGYDGHGNMGWKVHGWGGGHHGGGHHGGGYGGGAGGYGGGHHGGGGHGGWGWQQPHTHYGWGWAEKAKGWGWRR